jgi:HAD superfamily hydrolase (TIGR01509 family)
MYALVDKIVQHGVTVGLLSNIDPHLADLLKGTTYFSPFHPCVLSCDIGVQKPDLGAFRMLIEKIDLPPHNIVFIDDRIENVNAALKS